MVARPELENDVRARLPLWVQGAGRVPGARLVKESRQRTVMRVPASAPLPALYVKTHRVLGLWNATRSAVRVSRARLEFDVAARLERRGVLAPRPVACAEWKRGPVLRTAVTVWEEMPGAMPLDAYLAGLDGVARLVAVSVFGSELASRHQAGIDLVDCHRANLLAVPGAVGAPATLGLVDLASVRFGRVSRARRVRRLAQLLHSLEPALHGDESDRLLASYLKTAPLERASFEEVAREIRDTIRSIAARRERSRDRRCVVDSTEFAVSFRPARRVFRRRDLPRDAVDAIVGSAAAGEARLVKREGRNECFVVGRGPEARFVKRVRASSWLGALVDAFRGSRGRRAWAAAHAFRRRGLPTPRAHALVEVGPFVPWRSTLVVDAIEGAIPLSEFLADWPARVPTRAERRLFLAELAETIASLHYAGVDHDDLATKNVIVEPGPPRRFHVIDLEAVRSVGRRVPRERVLRALMQLDDCPRSVSRTDRMRFLVTYEHATRQRFSRPQIAEVRALLRERFERSKRDYERDGPR